MRRRILSKNSSVAKVSLLERVDGFLHLNDLEIKTLSLAGSIRFHLEKTSLTKLGRFPQTLHEAFQCWCLGIMAIPCHADGSLGIWQSQG